MCHPELCNDNNNNNFILLKKKKVFRHFCLRRLKSKFSKFNFLSISHYYDKVQISYICKIHTFIDLCCKHSIGSLEEFFTNQTNHFMLCFDSRLRQCEQKPEKVRCALNKGRTRKENTNLVFNILGYLFIDSPDTVQLCVGIGRCYLCLRSRQTNGPDLHSSQREQLTAPLPISDCNCFYISIATVTLYDCLRAISPTKGSSPPNSRLLSLAL